MSLSPWAERFVEVLNDGSRPAIFREEDLEHSGIAIDWPRRDPKYYNEGNVGYYGENIPIPQDGTDIDRLLASEQYQRGMFSGARTWELASLNRYLWGSTAYGIFPGGHMPSDDPKLFQEAYKKIRFTIDESKWFEFLQKFHWYDLFDHPSRPIRPAVTKGAPWSVDVPSVWGVLTPSIELVNRILRALINEHHSGLETLLFGRLVYWRDVASATNIAMPFDDAVVLLSPQMELRIAAVEKKAPYQNSLASVPELFKSQAIEARLNQLCAKHIWSFGPGDGWGWTQRRDEPTNWSLSFLSTQMLQHLREDNLTNAERLILQFGVAIVMFHELMHSILSIRYKTEGAPQGADEPFVDFDGVSEIGEAMEHRVFGGRYVIIPPQGTVPLTTLLHLWPSPLANVGIKNPNHPAVRDGAPATFEIFPALHISKLFSSEFWETAFYPRKSDLKFWHVEMLASTTRYYRGKDIEWQDFALDETYAHTWDFYDKEVVDAWKSRQRDWAAHRQGWFEHYARIWTNTPWGAKLSRRRRLDLFNLCFQAKDEFLGYECPTALVMTKGAMIDWRDSQEFLKMMPSSSAINNAWVYFTIGLLMFAAMPIRKAEHSEGLPHLGGVRQLTFTQSAEGRRRRDVDGWDAPQRVEIDEFKIGEIPIRKRAANVINNPLGLKPNDAIGVDLVPTHMGYLDLVDEVLRRIVEERAVVSGPWYSEILRVSLDLRLQRNELIDQYPYTHEDLWAKRWTFRAPKFNPGNEDWIQSNDEDKTWHRHAHAPSFDESPQPNPAPSIVMEDAPASPDSPIQPGYAPSVKMTSRTPSTSADGSPPPSSGSEHVGDTPSSGSLEFGIDDFGSPGDGEVRPPVGGQLVGPNAAVLPEQGDDDVDVDVKMTSPQLSEPSVDADVMEGLIFSNQPAGSNYDL